MIHLDTHVVAWLYAGLLERIPPRVQRALEQMPLRVSPMVHLELQYLFEMGRLTVPSVEILADLDGRLGLQAADTPFALITAQARELAFTRDPFDRIIAAHALVDGASLVTKDATLRAHVPSVLWE